MWMWTAAAELRTTGSLLTREVLCLGNTRIVPPPNSTTIYRTVYMTFMNLNYESIYIDVGDQWRMSDALVFQWTSFYDQWKPDKLYFVTAEENGENLHCVITGDQVFFVQERILKPCLQKTVLHKETDYLITY
jgi:hypothetical protein